MTHIGTQIIETQRLCLRRIEPRDAQAFYEMYRDEQMVRYIHTPLYTELSQAERLIETTLSQYENPDFYYWAIELKASGQFVGAIKLYSKSERDEVAAVGAGATPAQWGNGYMSEALRAVLLFAFQQVGYNRVEATHATQNIASGAVLRKAGMLYEGMLREDFKNAYGYHDSHIYGMLKKDF